MIPRISLSLLYPFLAIHFYSPIILKIIPEVAYYIYTQTNHTNSLDFIVLTVIQLQIDKQVLPALKYRIASFFKDKNFHELAFPRFLRGKFSRIVMDYKEYLLKSEHFEGKIFTNCF